MHANLKVDFYILDAGIDRLNFACQITEKAYHKQHRVFLHCNDQKQAFDIDDTLWTFKARSFIPHNIQGEGPTPPPPVQIGYSDQANGFTDILLNLNLEIPNFHSQFKRIIEIVDDSKQIKESLREHYRYYQSQSYKISSYKISKEQVKV